MMELPLLGDLELAVIEHLWAVGARDAKTLHVEVGEARGITLNTIQSTVERLHRKQLVMREKFGHAYRYAPAFSRAEWRARVMAEAAGDLDDAQAQGVLAAFVDLVARADRRQLDRLAELVSAARTRRNRGA